MTAVAPTRIGLIVPSSNTTMETELPQLFGRWRAASDAARSFTFHASRMRMSHVTDEELARMNAQTPRAAAEVADLRPDAVATACLVAIMAQGPGHHLTVEREIRGTLDAAGARAPVVSSAGALLAALTALGARRVSIVTPYMKPLTKLVAGYIEDAGFEVVDALSLEVSDNLRVGTLDPADLEQHWRRVDTRDCDALVLSACVQMPSLAAIDAVQTASGIPTLSAATATAWALLSALGAEGSIAGAGSLLAGPMPAAPTAAVSHG